MYSKEKYILFAFRETSGISLLDLLQKLVMVLISLSKSRNQKNIILRKPVVSSCKNFRHQFIVREFLQLG